MRCNTPTLAGPKTATNRAFTLGTAGGTLDASGTNTINWSYNGAESYLGSGNRTLTLSGVNTGTNTFAAALGNGLGGATSLIKAGPGEWVLTGASNYTGGVSLAGGTLNVGAGITNGTFSPLGALISGNTVSFNGGTLQFSAAGVYDYSGQFSPAASQTFSIDTAGQSVTFATGLASSGGTLIKLGPGTLALTGASTYNGTTTVAAGTLALDTTGTVLGNTAVTVQNGATLAASVFSTEGNLAIGSGSGASLTLNPKAGLNLAGNADLLLRPWHPEPGRHRRRAHAPFLQSQQRRRGRVGRHGCRVLHGHEQFHHHRPVWRHRPGPPQQHPLISAASGLPSTPATDFSLTQRAITIGSQAYNLSLSGSGTALNLNLTATAYSNYFWTGAGSDGSWADGTNFAANAAGTGGSIHTRCRPAMCFSPPTARRT